MIVLQATECDDVREMHSCEHGTRHQGRNDNFMMRPDLKKLRDRRSYRGT